MSAAAPVSGSLHADCHSVSVNHLPADLIRLLGSCPHAALQSILQVSAIGTRHEEDEGPSIAGRHQIIEDVLRFVPHFPFQPGMRFRAVFDPRSLQSAGCSESLVLEFSRPEDTLVGPTCVTQVFPSVDDLPENLLRFYVCFSNPMQRGAAETHIAILDPDGQPAEHVLYRPPVELWDNSMRCLTVLLDPGRLKRGVGPNRLLGPPLKAGRDYTLIIRAGMVDAFGRPVDQDRCKRFHVTRPLRAAVSPADWDVRVPHANSREALEFAFPAPLDWAQLWHAIAVGSEEGERTEGRVVIGKSERRWRFYPESPWSSQRYQVRIAPDLEDVCGNNLTGAFDRPLRAARELGDNVVSHIISFAPRARELSPVVLTHAMA
jgi:hypothetical protein